MKPLLERLRASRLASTFTILGTLSAGILIGSVAVHGVRGNETQTDSSDATPLKIPNLVTLSTTFTQIAKDVGPAVRQLGGQRDGYLKRQRNLLESNIRGKLARRHPAK